MKWLILLTTIIALTISIDEGDWVDPFDLPISVFVNPFFAGYLNISTTKALYYVYTPSTNNPSKDPLVVLISPGPGCSALHSWLYSKGQFTFTRNTTNFRNNPNRWNKNANVLYIQGPAGVGFTIGVDEKVSDNITVIEYFEALFRFYQKFPELKDQKMYLSGFGYAGIIAPKLALYLIQLNKNPDTAAWAKMNINGLLMFNPCTYAQQCDSHFLFNQFTVKFLRHHFFLTEEQYQTYRSHCTLRTSQCQKQQLKIESNFRQSGADLSNLYMECLHQPGDYGCIDHQGADLFFNKAEVKIDMHADTTKVWNLCNFSLSQAYERDPDGSLKTYQTLLTRQRNQNLRIWIVSGTLSARVPTWGTKKWVNEIKGSIGFPNNRLWQPWFYNKDINAGEIESIPGLTFLTIRSAGYYMFEDQPEIANYVYESFLKGATL